MLDASIVAVSPRSLTGDVARWIDEIAARLIAIKEPTAGGARWCVLERSVVSEAVRTAPADTSVADALGLAGMPSVAITGPNTLFTEAPPQGLLFVEGRRILGYLAAGEEVPEALRARRLPGSNIGGSAVSVGARRGAPAVDDPQTGLYPFTDGPASVQPDTPFVVEVGVSADADDATGARLDVATDGSVELEILVMSDEFIATGSARHTLVFDPATEPVSTVCVEMVTNPARSDLPHAWADSTGEIDFLFLHDGLPVGRVRHRVSVDVGGDETSTTEPGSWMGAEAPPCSMSIASSLPEPDLTIIITASAEIGTGRFVACLRSRHLEAGPVTAGIDLGSDAAAFAEVIMKTIPSQDGEVFIDETIAGISKVIARTVDDPQFWTSVSACLSAAQAQRGEAPSVLLLTSESFVPWELADIGATPVAPDAPPLLAAQARVGRWILDDVHCTPMADHLAVDIDRIATVVGEYQPTSGLARLPLAEEEGQYLRDQLGATYVSATADEVDIVLGARLRDPFQILHFACHGNVTPLGMNALYMNNGKELLHFAIEASVAGREYRPLVFLNACRVGAGQSQLNQYGGFAGSFLRAGYSGFIGPLWAVDDTVAHEVATDFYSGLATENRPAEILRTIRTRFVATDDVQAPPSTYLAYVFYGHPDLALNGVRSTNGAPQ